ncbi:YlxR family protein [uncultured Jatrophihabitans sp.]|uniref:YlxR family protein n=1 Tax=uncultured Jatrophihabitans sp. TaxID=1610747 RepID=UPI0035CAB31D
MNSLHPIRTCVGCRRRGPATELLRVVVAPDSPGDSFPVVPDPRRRMPGRGAWVHPSPGCVELAERRRAFGRALRVPGPVDSAPVGEYVAELETHPPADNRRR